MDLPTKERPTPTLLPLSVLTELLEVMVTTTTDTAAATVDTAVPMVADTVTATATTPAVTGKSGSTGPHLIKEGDNELVGRHTQDTQETKGC
mmetsp:Transcript_8075/g.15394  ORF Transcript_8075/g.15394 Transcript_8075/m.15394 type:complete len:92 (+) Transcript_8075:598-873(+)